MLSLHSILTGVGKYKCLLMLELELSVGACQHLNFAVGRTLEATPVSRNFSDVGMLYRTFPL